MIQQPFQVLRLVEQIAAVGVVVSVAELLAARAQLAPAGLLNYPVPRTRSRRLVAAPYAPVLAAVFDYPAVLFLLGIRLAAAAAVAVGAPADGAGTALVVLLAATSAAMSLRSPFGNDGADQMTVLVFGSAALARLAGTPLAAQAALWFLAAQTCLSYLTAGIAKSSARMWRDGTAIRGIFRTVVYGHARAGAYVARHPGLATAAGWSVIVTECAFVAVFVTPSPYVYVILAGGLGFHLASAVLMGLNTFTWAFGATYPALIFCASLSAGALWS
ncbi:hypothetical protein FHS39_000953 [Streptomyces olivoverticillatus]|uniref:HTTM-like domain-containing protein n=1 Tax=Streptomyces olivoverticillatus TaxID=66427 RepID=A0A7W7LKK5_9ACTN|nr:hypothetical protein [Streptomyces olivoverticillatus]MBB4891953.1 hypothetical protein [Streptomyces olivoverticillatus]